MSVSNNHIIEIQMIKNLIENSQHKDEIKKNLIDVIEIIVKVADTIIEWEDYIKAEDYLGLVDSSTDSEDSDYVISPTPQGYKD